MKVSETVSLIFSRDSSCVMYSGDTSVPETYKFYNLYVFYVLLDLYVYNMFVVDCPGDIYTSVSDDARDVQINYISRDVSMIHLYLIALETCICIR